MPARHHLTIAAVAKSHAKLLKSGATSATPWNQLLTAYSLSPLGLLAARQVFDQIPRPDAASWNSLLTAHVSAGAHSAAYHILQAMHERGLAANTFALGPALRSAAAVGCPALGTQLHSLIVKAGLAESRAAHSGGHCFAAPADQRCLVPEADKPSQASVTYPLSGVARRVSRRRRGCRRSC